MQSEETQSGEDVGETVDGASSEAAVKAEDQPEHRADEPGTAPALALAIAPTCAMGVKAAAGGRTPRVVEAAVAAKATGKRGDVLRYLRLRRKG